VLAVAVDCAAHASSKKQHQHRAAEQSTANADAQKPRYKTALFAQVCSMAGSRRPVEQTVLSVMRSTSSRALLLPQTVAVLNC
jgi:hypothetical protein